MQILLKGNAKRSKPLKVHFVCHSAGAIFLAEVLKSMDAINPLTDPIQSCSLLAPACTIDVFEKDYASKIGKSGAASCITKLWQHNLIGQRELDDTTGPYQKSLLYWVSNAFEEEKKMQLLGMEKFSEKLNLKPAHKIHYAGRAPAAITNSKSHGGFDNDRADRATMNNVLKNILGSKPRSC